MKQTSLPASAFLGQSSIDSAFYALFYQRNPPARGLILNKILRLFSIFCLFISLALLLKPLLRLGAVSAPLPAESLSLYAVYAGISALGALAAFALALAAHRRRRKKFSRTEAILRENLAEAQQALAAAAQNSAAAAKNAQAAETEAGGALAEAGRTGAEAAKNALLEAVPLPLWLRAEDGRLIFANKACRKLCAAENAAAGARKKTESAPADIEKLFSPAVREGLAQARRDKRNFLGRSNIILKGDRHIFACRSLYDAAGQSFLGLAEDITEKLYLKGEAERIKQGYSETFDRLSTSVAIFDPEMKLEFFNPAFAALWPLDLPFLESRPGHNLLLDRLREKGILNERPDWRQWKDNLFEAYRAQVAQHYTWNLPDGRTLRVVANPHPQGGVTWLFDDLSEKLALEARYNTLIQIQGETLDNLAEGVAVFGADGLLRLANPAFAELWNLPADLAVEGTHIEKIKSFCQTAEKTEKAENIWQNIALYITGFADKRDYAKGRIDLADHRVLDYMLVPLPQGQTMLSFVNVTASVNMARALAERNEALESADRLRNDFVQHVSYELRTPLTNIIGFTDLLRDRNFAAGAERQHEYLNNIAGESVTLLNLVNDILDLATVDAGIMELNISSVAIAEIMAEAAARLSDKLQAKNIALEQHIAAGLSNFRADKARLRQIFVNLLNNAAEAAPRNSHIRFCAERQDNMLAFTVEDEGAGIKPERRQEIFRRFTSYGKAGAGLGLAIVKSFVDLHQGRINIESGREKGTKLICLFPFHEIETQTGERAALPAPIGQEQGKQAE